MKPKLIIACVTVAVFSSCTHLGRNEGRSVSPLAARIHKALNETVIPEVDLEHVTADDALNVWTEKSRTYHPLHFKFQHIMASPMVLTQGTAQPAAVTANSAKVTVRRKNITSKRLLDEICRQANLTWTITGRVIVIKLGGQPAAAP